MEMSLGHLVAAAEIERVEISEDLGNRTWDMITRTTVCLQRRRNTLHVSPYTRKKSEGVMSADRRIAQPLAVQSPGQACGEGCYRLNSLTGPDSVQALDVKVEKRVMRMYLLR